ncbi:MAG: Na+/H+ antiporter subunit E [Xanthomonadales bacterium]|nr:Na+/H+ antiporter subunit E [Xanthomonadales bacterium]
MRHTISLGFVLALLWLGLSGQTAPLFLAFGAVAVGFALWMALRMDIVDRESHPVHLSLGLIRFWGYLLREIVLANVAVVREILRPRLAITPTVVEFESRQSSDLGKVVLGNAITLTPGTVTLDIAGGRFRVHGLTRASAESAASGELDRRIPADVEEGR